MLQSWMQALSPSVCSILCPFNKQKRVTEVCSRLLPALQWSMHLGVGSVTELQVNWQWPMHLSLALSQSERFIPTDASGIRTAAWITMLQVLFLYSQVQTVFLKAWSIISFSFTRSAQSYWWQFQSVSPHHCGSTFIHLLCKFLEEAELVELFSKMVKGSLGLLSQSTSTYFYLVKRVAFTLLGLS